MVNSKEIRKRRKRNRWTRSMTTFGKKIFDTAGSDGRRSSCLKKASAGDSKPGTKRS